MTRTAGRLRHKAIAEAAVTSAMIARGCPDPRRQRAAAIACGRHSGIPECCVAWFVRVWGRMPNAERAAFNARVAATPIKNGTPGWNRAPCPDCLAAGRGLAALTDCDCPWSGWRATAAASAEGVTG